jgi:hypothetical protein
LCCFGSQAKSCFSGKEKRFSDLFRQREALLRPSEAKRSASKTFSGKEKRFSDLLRQREELALFRQRVACCWGKEKRVSDEKWETGGDRERRWKIDKNTTLLCMRP